MMQERENFCYEDEEINLYDIVDIMGKYKKVIISILLIGFALSFALALYLRNYNRKEVTKQDFIVDYSILESSFYYQMINLNYVKFDPKTVFQKEEYIDRFLTVDYIKEEFEKKISEQEKFIIDKKIKALSEIIKLEENKGVYTLTVISDNKSNAGYEIIDIYFSILKEQIIERLKNLIKTEKDKAFILKNESSKKLDDIKLEIAKVLKSEKTGDISIDDMSTLFAFKEPRLAADNIFYQELYERTSKQLLGAENIIENPDLIEKIIRKTSSLIVTKEKGIAKYILLGGIFLSCFIVAIFIMLKEFIEGYKKHKEDKTKKRIS